MKISTIATALAFGLFATGYAPSAMSADATAKSIECSKEADAKGLRSKERKKFIAECRKGAT